MTTRTYQKAGESVRWERSRGLLAAVRVSEHGVAREQAGTFTAQARKTNLTADEPDLREVEALAERLDFGKRVEVERFTILSGNSAHRIEAGNQSREWSESFARLHISLVNRRHHLRASLDLGGAAVSDIDLDAVERTAVMLERFNPAPVSAESVVLRPHVAAALWSRIALARLEGESVSLEQATHPEFRFDGDGHEIQPSLLNAKKPWPNRYRPSYRSPPVAMPFHVRVLLGEAEQRPDHRALALLEPFRIKSRVVTATLLCHTDRGEAFPLPISVRLEEVSKRSRVVGHHQRWFPYAAGAWGSETALDLWESGPPARIG